IAFSRALSSICLGRDGPTSSRASATSASVISEPLTVARTFACAGESATAQSEMRRAARRATAKGDFERTICLLAPGFCDRRKRALFCPKKRAATSGGVFFPLSGQRWEAALRRAGQWFRASPKHKGLFHVREKIHRLDQCANLDRLGDSRRDGTRRRLLGGGLGPRRP